MAGEGLSAVVARHVAGVDYDALPAATVAATKRAVLDAIGVMLGASGLAPEVRPFIDLARAQPGPAVILGVGALAAPGAAALANGAMAHALDYEDAFDRAPAHPNAALIPAALAVAAGQGRTSGKALIVAVAVGCDLVCRMALSLRRPMEEGGWYPPPILGAFGAAAGAARLMGLDARGVSDALSLMLCQTACPGEIKYDRENVIRAVREAFPAQAAVTAAQLAAAGVRGFDAPLEGKAGFFRLFVDGRYDPAVILEGLGKRYWIEDLSFKPWPSCRGTHAYVEAALDLQQRHGFTWRDIERIETTGGEVHRMLVEPPERKQAPATAIDAKFSIPFTVAAALVHGGLGLDSFGAASLSEADILSLARRVAFELRADWGWEKAASGEICIVLKDGRRLIGAVETAAGAPSRPLSNEALRAKFIDCAARAASPIDRASAEAFADAVEALETCADVNQLVAQLHRTGREES